MRGVAVLKFARGSLRSPGTYENVARGLGQRLDLGQRLVVVVGHPDRRGGGAAVARALRDTLRATGRDVTARDGSGLGLVAEPVGPRDRLVRTDPVPLRRALLRHEVVVVPGGEAVGAGGRTAWLGEHGADLTAVALAAALGTGWCEFHSELGGVFTADPRTVPGARPLPEVSWETAALLGRHGARVLDPRAVRMARGHRVRLVFRRESRPLAPEGTVVAEGPEGTAVAEGPEGTAVAGGGAPVAAVVCERSSQGLRYADETAADRAFAAFHTAGFEAVRSLGRPVVALRGTDLAEYERPHGAAGGVYAGVPVTVLRGARATQFLAPDGDAALRLARRLHRTLLPSPAQAATSVR
ncbi:hypothetical protein [Streptomyces sp. NPDC005438]|uniref:amino acid kinase family protein n=1 Tax=Streptomyces sp. NPDC005438 TaxID=3156880 RepID=UPI00339FA3A3